ncbi:hypothetical protein MCOR27_000731 [Pyricularia oryzae]|uniref:Uncharacterized protein n=1 Tax=Pyricularia oryzae TaxID=318829 RepID=A0A4P7NAT2_PYROR|nr:hypothetical protein MCOR27_000731 [Pyricularia oryzae]KAI6452217.1 hypothetical protein MCOR22_000805 [Pyricularia oryzae]KAI6506967.1 hypothetical protein MCOR13_003116 [Pyricularia oryzae]KAI6524853.1 hypothetical protein MCOR05_009625 [Pyricularia oryzae]KAI6632929.1 hypothetical protein MCOR14_006976 [Pyricularia oryzae]
MQLDSTCVNRLQRIVEQGSDFLSHSPSLIHDAIRGINTVSLEDAIISEHGKTNDLDIYGNSPLHWAAVLGDTAAARTLLRHGSKQDIRSRNGNPPLLEACSWCDLKMATVLIDAGADVKITNSIGQTALHHAARSENPHLVRLLLGKGALPNAADKWGQTPLHCISMNAETTEAQAYQIVTAIVEAGGNVHLVNDYGETPLLRASLHNRRPAMRALVRHGARMDHLDNYGRGIIHYTLTRGSQKYFDLLRWESDLEGLDPDIKNMHGGSPIQSLCCILTLDATDSHVALWPRTHSLVFSASALVVELREQNWAAGRFLESRGELQDSGWHNALKRWLGAGFLAMQYDPDLQHEVWDPTIDWYFLEEDVDERQDPWEREPWVEDDGDGGCFLGLLALFGEDCDDMEDLEAATSHASDEDDEAFFDAVDF